MNAFPSFAQVKDSLGRAFDAVRFRLKDGKPYTNARGHFMPRGGRKPKVKPMESSTSPVPAADPAPVAPAPSPAAPSPAPAPAAAFVDVAAALKTFPVEDTEGSESRAPTAETLSDELKHVGENPTAETIIGLIQTGLILVGEEEGMLSPAEKDLIRRPLIRVLAKYNVGKDVMPAEADLAIAVLGVIAFRLQKPKTAKFAAKVRAWVVEKIFGSRGRKLQHDLQREVGDSVKPA